MPSLNPLSIQTHLGTVQYAQFGSGATVLSIHGTPGGYDQSVHQARFLADAGFNVIAVSRPGYLGTPLTDDNRSMPAQADLLAALLDELGLESVCVYSWSGGGPTGYYFALQHSDRATSLVALAAVCQPMVWKQSPADKFLMGTRLGNRLMRAMADHMPKQVIAGELASEGDLTKEEAEERVKQIMADPAKKEFALDLAGMTSTRGDRQPGCDNDLAIFADLAPIPLTEIKIPVMIVQGTADADLDPSQSYYAAEKIPNAQLVTIDRGTHLGLFLDPDGAQAQQQIIDFIRASTP